MSQDGKFWVACWSVVGATLVCIAITITVCSLNNNKLWKAALDKGCSVVRTEHRDYNIYCGNVKESNE